MKTKSIRGLAPLALLLLFFGGEVPAQSQSNANPANPNPALAKFFSAKIDSKSRRATLGGSLPKACVPHLSLKAEGEPDYNSLVVFTFVDRDGDGLHCLIESSKKPCTEDSCTSFDELAKDVKNKDRFQSSVEIKIKDLDGVRAALATQPFQPTPAPKPQAKLEASTPANCCDLPKIPGPQQSVERSLDPSTMNRVLAMAGADKPVGQMPPSAKDDDDKPSRRRSSSSRDDFDDFDDRPSSARSSRPSGAGDRSPMGGTGPGFSSNTNSNANSAMMAMMAQSLLSMGNGSMSMPNGYGATMGYPSMTGYGSMMGYGSMSSLGSLSGYGSLSGWGSSYPNTSALLGSSNMLGWNSPFTSLSGGMSSSLYGGIGSSLYGSSSLPSSPLMASGLTSPLLYGNLSGTMGGSLGLSLGSNLRLGSPIPLLFGNTSSFGSYGSYGSLSSYPSYYGYGR